MEYEPAEYQKLQIRQYAPRSIRETAEGKYWRRFKAPIVAKQVSMSTQILPPGRAVARPITRRALGLENSRAPVPNSVCSTLACSAVRCRHPHRLLSGVSLQPSRDCLNTGGFAEALSCDTARAAQLRGAQLGHSSCDASVEEGMNRRPSDRSRRQSLPHGPRSFRAAPETTCARGTQPARRRRPHIPMPLPASSRCRSSYPAPVPSLLGASAPLGRSRNPTRTAPMQPAPPNPTRGRPSIRIRAGILNRNGLYSGGSIVAE
jgi:hypothetical protein